MNRRRKLGIAVTILLAMAVAASTWAIGTPSARPQLTLTDCNLTVVGKKMVTEIPGIDENRKRSTWMVVDMFGQKIPVLLVAIKVDPPTGEEYPTLEVDNADLVVAFDNPDNIFGERRSAGALMWSEKLPDLNNPPEMMIPLNAEGHLGIHKDKVRGSQYLLAAFRVHPGAKVAELCLAKPVIDQFELPPRPRPVPPLIPPVIPDETAPVPEPMPDENRNSLQVRNDPVPSGGRVALYSQTKQKLFQRATFRRR